MLVPSIDLALGQAVQLIGGETPAIDAGDPRPIAARFSRVGTMAVIDLDAALSRGDNGDLIRELCAQYPCRVGGGIRDLSTARRWLDAGAETIIIGTAAQPDFLKQLPKDRLIAALDARDGEVVVKGWTEGTGQSVLGQMEALRDYVSGFLVTFVECEGRMGGTRMDLVAEMVKVAGDARVTIAGGITTAQEVAELDRLGADAQVGMALYSGRLSLADAFAAPFRSDRPDQLWPTVVVDQHDRALGLCYSNLESLGAALDEGRGIYWSRSRGLWRKGETSGATQSLISVSTDCDRDTLRFKVRQAGLGFCHLAATSCWGQLSGIPDLFELIQGRLNQAPEGSYTRRLLTDPSLLKSKLMEEADELVRAQTRSEAIWEAADLLYFALVKLAKDGGTWTEVEALLKRRALAVSRRAGDAKEEVIYDRPMA
ncbi:MAG: phosphoribosyl-ATP diphosphatase [Myxococcales bacterium]|nr:phosphoribosyl-ATP diphosphatase [Myxococcales bacterium]